MEKEGDNGFAIHVAVVDDAITVIQLGPHLNRHNSM
jgi:hypothetical protein